MIINKFKNKYKQILAGTFAVALSGLMALELPVTVFADPSYSELQSQKSQLESEVTSLDSELVDVLAQIDELEISIAETEGEIDATEENIKEGEKALKKQYSSMKTRMKYMYESGNDSLVETLVTSGSVSEFLNRVEYTDAVYEYDRNELESYESMVKDLQDMKNGLEQDKLELKEQKNSLASQKKSLNATIAAKKNEIADFDEQLAAAEAAAQEQAEANTANGNTEAEENNGSAVSGGGKDPSSSVNGSAIIAYARKFIGCKYIWGAGHYSTLAKRKSYNIKNGVDCSGFVSCVYAHFGIMTPNYSQAFKTYGKEVSLECIKPGDIVVYSGHVAMYSGNGLIIEAMNPSNGVVEKRSVKHGTILAIRRAT